MDKCYSKLKEDNNVLTGRQNGEVDSTISPKAEAPQVANQKADALLMKLLSACSFRGSVRHTWQWLISSEEYKCLKQFVNSVKIPAPAKLGYSFAMILRLYLGEFYKREWEGRKNPFGFPEESVNSGYGRFAIICEVSGLPVYRKVYDTHLQTLFVDGGLPIHYIIDRLDSNNTNQFIDSLSLLLETEDEVLIKEGEIKFERSTGSTALRESYQMGLGHSIYDYVTAIRSQARTWSQDDESNSEFSGFIERVKAARIKQETRSKFKMQYSLWSYCEQDHILEFGLWPTLCFKSLEKFSHRNFAITVNKLQEWGLKLNANQFLLEVAGEQVLFSMCMTGDYIAQGLRSKVDLEKLNRDTLTRQSIDCPPIRLICVQDGIDIELPLEKSIIPQKYEGILQLYTNDNPTMALWQSYRGNQSFRWSCAIFDRDRYEAPQDVCEMVINQYFGLVFFEDKLEFFDKYKGISFALFNRRFSLFAAVDTHSIHPIVGNKNIVPTSITDGSFYSSVAGKQVQVFLVLPNNIRFSVGNSDTNEMYDIGNSEELFSVSYQSLSSPCCEKKDWLDYDPNVKLSQGLYVFCIKCGSSYTLVHCMVLPEDAGIDTYFTSSPHKIIFHKIAPVSTEGLRSKPGVDSIAFFVDPNNEQDTFKFDVEGFVFEVYNPRPQTHTYVNGKVSRELLLPFADNIRVDVISGEGCHSFYLSTVAGVYKRLFSALTATVTGERLSPLQPIMLKSIDEGIVDCSSRIRIYTQNLTENDDVRNLFLLNLNDNSLTPLPDKNAINFARTQLRRFGEGLIFQSLKGIVESDTYYAPQYISSPVQRPDSRCKALARRERLDRYVEESYWVHEYSFRQFDIAAEHNLYFAVFDSLLCLLWDRRQHAFYPTNRTVVRRLGAFLSGYASYCGRINRTPDILALSRFAREFQFNWKDLSRQQNTFDRLTEEIYEKLIIR